jgi:hypothetical protein
MSRKILLKVFSTQKNSLKKKLSFNRWYSKSIENDLFLAIWKIIPLIFFIFQLLLLLVVLANLNGDHIILC